MWIFDIEVIVKSNILLCLILIIGLVLFYLLSIFKAILIRILQKVSFMVYSLKKFAYIKIHRSFRGGVVLNSIILCNTGADLLSIINLKSLEIKKILFSLSETPVGPHSIRVYEDKIISANNYNDSISIFLKSSMQEIKNISVGPKPNDLVQINNKIYTICG